MMIFWQQTTFANIVKKKKLLLMSNFSFCHNVFNSTLIETLNMVIFHIFCQHVFPFVCLRCVVCGKGLNMVRTPTRLTWLSVIASKIVSQSMKTFSLTSTWSSSSTWCPVPSSCSASSWWSVCSAAWSISVSMWSSSLTLNFRGRCSRNVCIAFNCLQW